VQVNACDVETGELERLAITDLRPVSSSEPSVLPPELDDRDWAEARRRLDLIEPVLKEARLPRAVMAARAREGGVEVTPLYRWARAFRTTGLLSSLLRYKPAGGRGKSRLEPAVEQIVLRTIEEHSLTLQQRSIESTAAEVARRCWERQLPAPHAGTTRRIVALPMRGRLSRRSHRKAALARFVPRPESFDEAQRSLDSVEFDHTKLDVIVVDEQQRLPIGRPWIPGDRRLQPDGPGLLHLARSAGGDRDRSVHRSRRIAERNMARRARDH
jgi:putative transposase